CFSVPRPPWPCFPPKSEVRIQKVEKIEFVYNLLTKPLVPSVYTKPVVETMIVEPFTSKKKAGNASRGGIVSVEDINRRSERYIREKKKQFLG
ncbi:hypothetical protein BAE44_0007322, partial [Dichanthelium oligosanthes]